MAALSQLSRPKSAGFATAIQQRGCNESQSVERETEHVRDI